MATLLSITITITRASNMRMYLKPDRIGMQSTSIKHILNTVIIIFIAYIPLNAFSQAPVITYATPQTYNVGTPITPLTPANSGTAAVINGQTSTFAGSGSAGSANGIGTAASFNQPLGTAVDAAGNVYIADAGAHIIRKITPAGVVSTLAGGGYAGFSDGTGAGALFAHPVGLATDASGNVYVADENNNRIRKITPAGVVTTIAGTGAASGINGAALTQATFNLPCGVAVDASGNVYVADYNNNAIRMISTTGVVSNFAGSGAVGSNNASGTLATFNHPFSVTIDASGYLYVADRLNNMIRKITPAGAVTTLAGQLTAGFADNATGTSAKFNIPTTITVDGLGNVYVADEVNNRIRAITPAGAVTTLSGTGTAGIVNSIGNASQFYYPFAVAVDASGNVYVGDYMNNLVRKVASTPFNITPALPAGLYFNTATGAISGTPTAVSAAATYNITAFGALINTNCTAWLNMAVNPAGSLNLSQNQNYITTYTPRVPLITTSAALYPASTDKTQVATNIQYFDGLGRALQTIAVRASPLGRDIVQPIVYDQFGREATKYLPYTAALAVSDGSYKSTAITDEASFYNNPGGNTWNAPNVVTIPVISGVTPSSSSTGFEPSPLNRVVEQGAPGTAWQLSTSGVTGSGHTVKVAYGTNAASDVILWTVNTGGTGATGNTNYAVNQLYSTTSTDENGHSSIQYKDILGKVVCKKVQSGVNPVTYNATYYVYDNYNNLAYVVPPIPSVSNPALPAYPTGFAETDAVFLNYIYGYHYDSLNRLIEKKIPGKGWEYMVYNTFDKVVATQDAVQRGKATQEWTFTKYDVQGRVAITGIYQYSGSTPNTSYRVALQITVAGVSTLWETPITTGTGYTTVAWPISWTGATLSINYYDNYTNIPSGTSGMPGTFIAPGGASTMTKGLLVASQVNVVGSSNMLWAAEYYDDLGRVIQTYKQHYLGGAISPYNYDLITSTYDFTNAITTTTRQHFNTLNTTPPLVTVFNRYIYDHVGRKLKTWQQITNGTTPGTKTLISQASYNELGQLMTKHLHCTDTTVTTPVFLQNTAYTYNERGWLRTSNSGYSGVNLLTLDFRYNTPDAGTPKFNGDITEMLYNYNGPVVSNKTFLYTYDAMDRLNNASSGGTLDETIAYDCIGNITNLTRLGGKAATLSYKYTDINNNNTGNQLQTVSNNSLAYRTYGYDANGNTTSDGGTKIISYNILDLPQTVTQSSSTLASYTYDAGGAKIRNTGSDGTWDYIGGIVYNKPVNGTTSTILFIQTEEGKAVSNAGTYNYEYDLKDNLGNVRMTIDKSSTTGLAEVRQEDEYYSFGLRSPLYDNSNNSRYLYNGKERQTDLTDQYDYGARFYDPVIGRWTTVDPLAEKYHGWSPYNYGVDNPIGNTDPDGMGPCPECAIFNLKILKAAGKFLVNTAAFVSNFIGGENSHRSFSKDPAVRAEAQRELKGYAAAGVVMIMTDGLMGRIASTFGTSVVSNSVWALDASERGFAIEQMLGGNLPYGFPVIDKFNPETGVATSIKSIDVTADSYTKGNGLFNTLKSYVNKLDRFQGATRGNVSVEGGDITSKVLEVGIQPGKATLSQWEQIGNAIKYAKDNNIEFKLQFVK